MGFAICYRSTRPVNPAKAAAIEEAASILCHGHTWLSCEPVDVQREEDGHLSGFSKPRLMPPDGTTRDLLDILCQLSRKHGVDWEISHDYSGGPVGHIRKGIADGQIVGQMEALADIDFFEGQAADPETRPGIFPPPASRRAEDKTNDDDDGGPMILPFRPKGE
jgi:hypothetical protein